MSDAPRTDPAFSFHNAANEPLVAIYPDGSLQYGPGYDPDDAARQFWGAMAVHMPARQPDTELVALREDNARLRGLLGEVVGKFIHQTHPGERCLQTGHVRIATVERWREALRP
ncbi:hypothetical protein OG552_10385 [Streptomyces sp. NBC_01476]|uniref:hypothetical protein n=1 Tax=Streptomyces sp. NBC_01476 TaxID=2903881 RepID=UPI002E30A3C3|nr:hypothetical protein [Streptomyces sp. NBC_01476]